ncbi:CGL44 [Auxenochlorella protothecoides x Auxenochlorella symbiontica]
MSSPSHTQSSVASTVFAVGLGVGVAAVAGVAVGAMFGASALSIAAASKQQARPPLTAKDLRRDEEGRILNWRSALRIIQQGGISPELRGTLWPFLLGVFSPDSTEQARARELVRLRGVYAQLLRVCERLEAEARAAAAAAAAPGHPDSPSKAARAAVAFGEAHRIIVMDGLRTDLRGGAGRGVDPGAGLSVLPISLDGGAPDILLVRREEDEEDAEARGAAGAGGAWDGASECDGGGTAAHAAAGPAGSGSPPSAPEPRRWDSRAARDALAAMPEGAAHAPRTLRLIRLLSAYSVHDPETGYCQGMSDLAAVVVMLVPDEALAFACFERVMRHARRNFRHDETGIKHQLLQLAHILSDTDPPLYARLRALDSGDCMFAYRMVVVMLRRELPLPRVLLVWEAAWAHAAAAGRGDGVPVAAGGWGRGEAPCDGADQSKGLSDVEATDAALGASLLRDGGKVAGGGEARHAADGAISGSQAASVEAAALPAEEPAPAPTAGAGQAADKTTAGGQPPAVAKRTPSQTGSAAAYAGGTSIPPPDFVLQFIAAVVRGQRRQVMSCCHGTDDVLRLFSGVQIDFWLTLAQAQKQYKAYSQGGRVPRAGAQ